MTDAFHRVIREPAALLGLITLALGGGALFGWWTLTEQQTAWVLGIVGALILVLRQYVTPVGDPNLPIGTVVNANSDQPTGVVTPVLDATKPAATASAIAGAPGATPQK